ncbi:hypothetical protein OIU84_015759 [Salix udensis]|uniref:Uncharacterized protein n=1 Tax=Salix udensis TaxID=889485 RepID=A0AAD6J8C1_9ROSI|nr:hypothetical protein OIU84_015759 [Salix udensis]
MPRHKHHYRANEKYDTALNVENNSLNPCFLKHQLK